MVRCLNGFANSFVLIDFDESLTSRYFFILRVSRVGYEMRMLRITTVSTAVPLLGSFVFEHKVNVDVDTHAILISDFMPPSKIGCLIFQQPSETLNLLSCPPVFSPFPGFNVAKSQRTELFIEHHFSW